MCDLAKQCRTNKQKVASSRPFSANVLCTFGKALNLTRSSPPRSANRELFMGGGILQSISTHKFASIGHGCRAWLLLS